MATRIRIGNQTSKHVPARLPYEFALVHHFDAFEWLSDRGRGGWYEGLMDAAARQQLRKQAADRDLLFSVHVPIAADPVQHEGAVAIRQSIDFAADVAAGIVNVHLFPEHDARPYAEALVPLLIQAASAGVRLSLENTPSVSPDHVNAVFGVLSTIPEARGRAGFCLDMGHANLNEHTQNRYVDFVDLLGDHVPIIHWHAHENWGDRDSHLPLFSGPSSHDERGLRSLVKRLIRRGFNGSVVLEQWPTPPEQLIHARDGLRQLWDRLAAEITA